MSGVLDDGTSGLWTIKNNGGVAIVQNPEEAMYSGMPKNALEHVEVDHVATTIEMGNLIKNLIAEKVNNNTKLTSEQMELLKMEVMIAAGENAFEIGILDKGKLTVFTCPECQGSLVSFKEGKIVRYRCHTGHAYTTSSLLASVTDSVEQKLVEALRALEETTMLLKLISIQYKEIGNHEAAKKFAVKAGSVEERAKFMQKVIMNQELMSEDMRFQEDSA